MEMIPFTEACDEREEGEIIDDLEDVSDSSMFPGSPVDCGKSVSPPELLSAVCLSSVRSNEYSIPCLRNYYDESFQSYNNKKQWKHKRKRKVDYDLKRRSSYIRHHKRPSFEVHSESDNELVDPKYAKQLKDALKRESPQELHNSLRTRLKGFIEPHSDDESNLTALRDIALLSTKNSDILIDQSEPEKLDDNKPKNDRIKENFEDSELFELRMAALRSVVIEKHERRKMKGVKMENCEQETSDIDKENDQSIINNDLEMQPVKQSDCDNLDNKQQMEDNNVRKEEDVMEDDVDILRAMLLANMSKTLANKFPTAITSKVQPKQVTEMKNDRSKGIGQSLANHVIVKPLIIKVNADSDSDTEETEKAFKDTVTQFLKKQRAEVEENVKKTDNLNSSLNKLDDSLMDKSVMKLLPRSQQLEYRQLKQRLINARKKTKLRRQSQRISENKRDSSQNNKKVPKIKIDTSGSSNTTNTKVFKNNQERKNTQSSSNLQKTLNELQIRKNGRLQMKGKYRSLGALLHKINQASNVRRQHELEIKKLLQDIQKARIKLATSHQTFTNLVQQLVKEKQIIDQRTYNIVKTPMPVAPVTSTPKQINKNEKENLEIANPISCKTENCKEQNELLEPNDVTKVFVKELEVLPKYISPLDSRDGIGINDALMTLCPYDLLGTCKDKECQYMHCA